MKVTRHICSIIFTVMLLTFLTVWLYQAEESSQYNLPFKLRDLKIAGYFMIGLVAFITITTDIQGIKSSKNED